MEKQANFEKILSILDIKEGQRFTLKNTETNRPLNDIVCRITKEKGLQFLAGTETWVICDEWLTALIIGNLEIDSKFPVNGSL